MVSFKEAVLEFLWHQWCELGVAGSARASSNWLIDPEPLIPFSLYVARQDARMFDEMLDWLLKNGEWINVHRLITIVRSDSADQLPLIQAVAETITNSRRDTRWKLVARIQEKMSRDAAPLFSIHGRLWDPGARVDPVFLRYGFMRSPVSTRGMSHDVSMSNPRCLAFRTRSLFGVSVRADVITYLATQGPGHPSGISRLLGVSQKQVQDTLVEMAHSGLVCVQQVGRRKDYWLDPERWHPFLFDINMPPVSWIDWRALTRGISALWTGMSNTPPSPMTNYVASSIARRAMRSARDDLLRSRVGIRMTDDRPYRGESYLDIFLSDIQGMVAKLLGSEND